MSRKRLVSERLSVQQNQVNLCPRQSALQALPLRLTPCSFAGLDELARRFFESNVATSYRLRWISQNGDLRSSFCFLLFYVPIAFGAHPLQRLCFLVEPAMKLTMTKMMMRQIKSRTSFCTLPRASHKILLN